MVFHNCKDFLDYLDKRSKKAFTVRVKKIFIALLIFVHSLGLYAGESYSNTLDQEKFKAIAKKLFIAQKLVPEKYEYAGNITLGLYFLRYLGDLGEFDLTSDGIGQLITAVEKLYGEELNQTLKELLFGIHQISFYQKGQSYFAKISTKQKKTLKVAIDVKREGLVQSINDFNIENGATIKLRDIKSERQRKKYYQMLLKKKEVFQLPKVHLVEESFLNGLKYYLTLEHEIYPIAGSVTGMGFNISLNRWFPKTMRTIDLEVGEIGSFLGIEDLEGNQLSPFWLSAKKWWVHVISTLDN